MRVSSLAACAGPRRHLHPAGHALRQRRGTAAEQGDLRDHLLLRARDLLQAGRGARLLPAGAYAQMPVHALQ